MLNSILVSFFYKECEPTTGTDRYLLLFLRGGKPTIVYKSTDKLNSEQLRVDKRKYFSHFPSEPSDRKWWSEFLDSCGKYLGKYYTQLK